MSYEIRNISGFRYCKCLGLTDEIEKLNFLYKRTLYKYMNMENAMKSLDEGYVFFQEPSKWSDGFEKWFYNANYDALTKVKDLTPKMFACCFTFNQSSEAAWNTYSYDNKGLASRCVQFVLYRKGLRNCFEQYAKNQNGRLFFYEGKVNYSISSYFIQRMHEPSNNTEINKLHDQYFGKNNFSKDKYMSALLIKRPAFEYENEVRFLFEDKEDPIKNADKPESKKIPVNWDGIIVKIIVEETCTDVEFEIFKRECKRICEEKGWKEFTIERSNLHAKDLKPATIRP